MPTPVPTRPEPTSCASTSTSTSTSAGSKGDDTDADTGTDTDADARARTCVADADNHNVSNGSNSGGSSSHVTNWDQYCGLSKLSVFALEQYDRILYIDADCLVVQDVGHLLFDTDSIGSSDDGRRGLMAAAPDIFPPDK